MSQTDNILMISDDVSEWGQWLHNQVGEKLSHSDKMPLILLAHTDDGVLWGQLVGANLTWSSDEFKQLSNDWQRRVPQINLVPQRKILQQLRLFNETGELLIWRDGNQFKYRFCLESEQTEDSILQTYCLWGDRVVATMGIFKLLQEGERGLWHAPPANAQDGIEARLFVRHYVNYDDKLGQAYVSSSRVLGLEWR